MNVKYFQPIADIKNHYNDILYYLDDMKFGHMLLETWGITPNERELLMEERDVVRYLLACKYTFAHDKDVKKPTLEAVQRCFERHLFFLDKIHHCNASTFRKHRSKLSQKEYMACRHYLFQFSLPAWYAKLPDEILTLENRLALKGVTI